MDLVALVAERVAGQARLELADFGERRVAEEVAFRRSHGQVERHVQVGATILARSIERLLDPLRSERQVDSFAVSHEKKSQRTRHLRTR